jgi:hypothetical protein
MDIRSALIRNKNLLWRNPAIAFGTFIFTVNMVHMKKSSIIKSESEIDSVSLIKVTTVSAVKGLVYGFMFPVSSIIVAINAFDRNEAEFKRHLIPDFLH